MTTKKAYSPFIECDCWKDFVQISREARIVVYNLRIEEGSLQIYAIKQRIFTYQEHFSFPQKTEITKNGSKWRLKTYKTNNEKQPTTSDLVVFSRQPLQKKFECGIPYSVIPKLTRKGSKWAIELKCAFDSETVAEFLSEALKVSRDRVIEGDVYSF